MKLDELIICLQHRLELNGNFHSCCLHIVTLDIDNIKIKFSKKKHRFFFILNNFQGHRITLKLSHVLCLMSDWDRTTNKHFV